MWRSMVLLLVSVILGIGGQLAIKMGVGRAGDLQELFAASPWRFVMTVARSPFILIGIGLYALSMLLWLLVLSRVDLSLAYPMLALGYVGVLLVSKFALQEEIPAMRWLGTGLIVLGVVLNAITARKV
ncbi:MAG: EamA family transporter [Bacillota bacterium]